MLRLDLVRLEREGSLPVEADVSPDDPLWDGGELRFDTPLQVRLLARVASSGEIVIRGTLSGEFVGECRRCLEPAQGTLNEEVTLVFVEPDESGPTDAVDERIVPRGARHLDLGAAIREELMLAWDPYVVCDPGCRGLCPLCGTNRNENMCDCSLERPDPRWDALRALTNE